MQKRKRFIFNGLLLTAVSLMMRSVSVSFQVYLSNTIGASAMGLFSLIATVYGFGVTVATSGIQFATTRLVAEALGQTAKDSGNHTEPSKTVPCILRKCIVYALCFSIASGLVLYGFSPIIGQKILGDARTILPLRILSVSLPAIALTSVFNGYFTAIRKVYKNAAVQVGSEAIRIFACMALLHFLLPNDVEYAILSIVLSGTLAELSSFLFQFILFLWERKQAKAHRVSSCEHLRIRKRLLHIALPVAFSAYVRSALITIEHLLIPRGLNQSGSTREESLAAYGTVHSMVFPLLLFPAALSSSFAGLLVPEIAEAKAARDDAMIHRTVHRVLETVLLYAIGVAGILMCFSHSLGQVIYPGTNAGRYILMLAPLIPVMYLDTSVDAILKGLGQQVYHMGINILDSLLSVILVIFLLPRMGIIGYIVTVYFTELVNSALSLARLFSVTHIRPKIGRWVIKPLVCIILSTTAVRHLCSSLFSPIPTATNTLCAILLTAVLYLALISIGKHHKHA